MRNRASSVGKIVAVVVAALAAYAGCTTSKTGGETHWLAQCATDRDCGTGQCLCGLCTHVCASDGDCGGPRSAQCYAAASPGLPSSCGSAVSRGAGICLAVCGNDSDCPSGDECHLGACVPAATSAPTDAGPPPTTTGDIAKRYVHADAGTAFGELVAAPGPSPFIDGNTDALLGVWQQIQGDGGPCMPPFMQWLYAYESCVQLEITKDAVTGKVVGRWTTYGTIPTSPFASSPTDPLPGPFPPATDPDHGYPVGVDPARYFTTSGITFQPGLIDGAYVGAQYTLFDGHVDGEVFSFWTSGTELWKDWCALQTPHPFQFEGMDGYRCVPQDATASNTDLGKFLLCTSLDDEGLCTTPDVSFPPSSTPCSCLHDAGRKDPRCSVTFQPAICTCTATRCGANLHAVGGPSRFVIEGNTMRSDTTSIPMSLRRVSP